MQTLIISPGEIHRAAEIIKRGGLCAVPTETVYGLAGNGLCAAAVSDIYAVKGRPEQKPLSLLVAGIKSAASVCADIPEQALLLAEAFWPGPLTIVLKKRDGVPDIVTAGGDTVGIRCPDHPAALELLRLTGLPLAAPSANVSGMPSPKNVPDVLRYFDGKIDGVIDGGECKLGVESTVADLTSGLKILRRGALSGEELRRVLAQSC